MDRSCIPCKLVLAFLKEMITERSRVGSRVRDTRMQSRHKTIIICHVIRLTCIQIVRTKNLLDVASFVAFKFLLFGAFDHLIMFQDHHIQEINEQIVRILLLETTEARVTQADP